MKRESVNEAIKGLFAERRPGWPPDPSILKAWVDHIMDMEGMTEEKVWDGCIFLGEHEGDFHLGTLVSAIKHEANKKAREEQSQKQRKEWKEAKKHQHKAPKAAVMAIQMWKDGCREEPYEEMVARQNALLEAMEEEERNSKGVVREAWIQARLEYERHCERFRVIRKEEEQDVV